MLASLTVSIALWADVAIALLSEMFDLVFAMRRSNRKSVRTQQYVYHAHHSIQRERLSTKRGKRFFDMSQPRANRMRTHSECKEASKKEGDFPSVEISMTSFGVWFWSTASAFYTTIWTPEYLLIIECKLQGKHSLRGNFDEPSNWVSKWKKVSAWNDAKKQSNQVEGKSGFEIKNQLPNEVV